eukprot:CAMPEP_0177625516 /NCGR_PEP_ID=MMETSP0419_2-20121207/30145_1 /TAXON_ID=582737 /ORGANISM="Tetraselmis sp., Strain GSL018" /LENGTH=352 /DNA_ID=CAMNT_0019126475 /DNA_START=320 /DNA_END=1375 /DNA_ORIENTATION=-
MGGSLTYNHEDGMNFDYILPDLIVGSCPQSAFDVDRLVEEGVGAIFCLQEDHDAQYFGFEIEDIQLRCEERGDIVHVRCPVRDFDPFNLRLKLPTAVAKLHAAQRLAGGKSVYVHCTAGLGRAPGAALAYMFWMRGFDLTEAYNLLMEKRPCHPKLEAIRAATCDILFESSRTPCEILVSRFGTCSSIQVSGLDVGWGQFLDLGYDPARRAFCLRRELLPGKYPYKLVWDGHWSYSADHPTFFDGENTNNYIKVKSKGGTAEDEARGRLTSAEGTLSPAERELVISPSHPRAGPASGSCPGTVPALSAKRGDARSAAATHFPADIAPEDGRITSARTVRFATSRRRFCGVCT